MTGSLGLTCRTERNLPGRGNLKSYEPTGHSSGGTTRVLFTTETSRTSEKSNNSYYRSERRRTYLPLMKNDRNSERKVAESGG